MSDPIQMRLPAVGLIGPGTLGRPIAARLMRGGRPLAVHARRHEAALSLIEAGATWCATARELAAVSDIVFIVVSDTPDVEQVLFGPHGVIEGARPGALVIDLSTISPQASREFARRLAERGVDMLDAPVSGGEASAIDGTLSVMVGGGDAALARARPLLDVIGSTVVHVGEHGAGQVAKSCNQIITSVTIEAVAEALTLARRLGADPGRVRAALGGGFAASSALEQQGARMIARDFSPGLRAAVHARDLGIVIDSAHALGLDLPASAIAAQQLNALVGAGEGDLDTSAMIKVLERMIGDYR